MAATERVIQAMLIGLEEDVNIFCQPCDNEGPRAPAYGYCTSCNEHLCECCFNHHRKHTMSRNHKLLDKENMPQVMNVSEISQPPDQADALELQCPCPKHPKEFIQYFCDDHEEFECSVCSTLGYSHKNCINVRSVCSIQDGEADSTLCRKFLQSTENLNEKCYSVSEQVNEVLDESEKSLELVLAEVEQIGEELKKKTDELVNKVKDNIKGMQQENKEKLKIAETGCDEITKYLQTTSDSIRHLNKSHQHQKLFVELVQAEKRLRGHKKCLEKLTACSVFKQYIFKPNESITMFLETDNPLGKIQGFSQFIGLKANEVPPTEEIHIKTARDRKQCFVTGITRLNPDNLIVIDKSNEAIKLVNTKKYICPVTSQLQLGAVPTGVTTINWSKFAVTLTVKQTIQLVSVTENGLTATESFVVNGYCLGLCYHQQKLVVTYALPSKVEVLSMSGKELITVCGDNLFREPEYVAANSSSIYVSDRAMGSIIMLNWQGQVTRRYGNIAHPAGITVTLDGTLFVCESDKRVIKQISDDGSQGKILIKGQERPKAICWCDEENKLYFSQDVTIWNEKQGNFIQVYQLQ